MRTVKISTTVRIETTHKVDLSAPDSVVVESYITETGGSLVWLPVEARAAIIRAAIVEAKDQEAAYVDADTRR